MPHAKVEGTMGVTATDVVVFARRLVLRAAKLSKEGSPAMNGLKLTDVRVLADGEGAVVRE
jgi:hypothetical protein